MRSPTHCGRSACATCPCLPRRRRCGARFALPPRTAHATEGGARMYAFDYARPQTLKDAAAVLRRNAEARLLAGGQSLVPALRLRLAQPPLLCDLGAIGELRGIRVENNVVSIGAMTRHAEVAASREV